MENNQMHPNGSVLKQAPRFGHVVGANNEFLVDGDLHAAYHTLKEMFEPTKDSKSGPIRPLTEEEKTLIDNRELANTIEEIPPTHS